MPMLPPKSTRKHLKGQSDHLDAWLISYADLITLLFMLFVIFVSISASKGEHPSTMGMGESDHIYPLVRSGDMALGTPYDETYQTLKGIVLSNHADQHVAVEKSPQGVWVDISSGYYFKVDSADISAEGVAMLKEMAGVFKANAKGEYIIEVEGHTDDKPVHGGGYANNWELAAMRATRMINVLINEGVDPVHLRAVSYAGTRPLVPNTDAAGRAIVENQDRNQRMVIKLGQLQNTTASLTHL